MRVMPKEGQRAVFSPNDVVIAVRRKGEGWVALVAKPWGAKPIKVMDSKGKVNSFSSLHSSANDYFNRTIPNRVAA